LDPDAAAATQSTSLSLSPTLLVDFIVAGGCHPCNISKRAEGQQKVFVHNHDSIIECSYEIDERCRAG